MSIVYQFGCYCFHPTEGIVTGGGVRIQLTRVESNLLCVLCERIGQIVDASELFALVWRMEAISGWRARIDTHLTSLRKKLQPLLPQLIQNHRGRGYGLGIAPTVSEPSPAVGTLPAAKHRFSRHQLMARLLPEDAGGSLGQHSDLVIQSVCPIELLPEYSNRVVNNILNAKIRYTVLLSAQDINVIAEFATMALESLRRRAPEAQETTRITKHALFPILADHFHVVLTPYPCVDSIYIANANSQLRAEAYYYLSDEQGAIQLKEGDAAKRHASELLRTVPRGQNGIFRFALGITEKSAIQKQIRKELLRRFDCVEDVHDLVPDEQQHLQVVPRISG